MALVAKRTNQFNIEKRGYVEKYAAYITSYYQVHPDDKRKLLTSEIFEIGLYIEENKEKLRMYKQNLAPINMYCEKSQEITEKSTSCQAQLKAV